MIRKEIFDLISQIVPSDALEEEHRRFAQNWIVSGADLFRRVAPAVPDVHLISYFLPFDREKNCILLVDHIKAGMWLPPGGHVDPDEHPTDCAKRETQEELGIKAQFLTPEPLFLSTCEVIHPHSKHLDVALWYAIDVKSDDPLNYDPREFHQIRWFPLDQLPNPTDSRLPHFLDKLIDIISGIYK